MDGLLAHLPDWVGLLLFTLVPAAIAIGAHAIFRRYVLARTLIPHHEVAGFLVAVVGVLYAVVLGFLVVTAWAAFDSAQRNADGEAGDVAEVFLASRALPEPTRSRVQMLMSDYAFEVRDREWPILASGGQDLEARRILLDAFDTIAAAPIPARVSTSEALRESALRSAMFSSFHDLSIERRHRLLDAENHVQGALYFALILGALMVMAFVFLFGVEGPALQLTMTGLVAGSIGLLLGLTVEFDRPYGHGIRVTPSAWTFVIDTNHMAKHRSAPPPLVRGDR
jgi:hypothetical protein